MILLLLLLPASVADGAVLHIPIKSTVTLNPGQAVTITVEATEPLEIGWQTVQAKRWTTNCVQATDITGGISYTIATPLGAAMKYTPTAGKITVEYKNVSSETVTTPKDQYGPYVISGQALGETPGIVLKSIDTCAPKAPKFGVPEQNVFK